MYPVCLNTPFPGVLAVAEFFHELGLQCDDQISLHIVFHVYDIPVSTSLQIWAYDYSAGIKSWV